jgi:hypothetical protein
MNSLLLHLGEDLHGQWGLGMRRSVRSGWLSLPWHFSGLPGVLLGSRVFWVLRWTMPETILGDVASWCGFTWRLSLPTWGSMWMG